MGQSNSQRKMQHQSVELWALYNEEERTGSRSRRNGGGSRSENTRRDSDRSSRNEYGRSNEYSGRNANAGRRSRIDGYDRNDSGRIERAYRNRAANERVRASRNSRSAGTVYRDSEAGNRNAVRRNGNSRNMDHPDDRVLSVYAQGRRTSRAGVSGSGSRQAAQTARRPESASRNRRRPREASRISYIQPGPGAEERRRNPETVYRGNARPVHSIKRRRARRRRELLCKAAILVFMVACLGMIYYTTGQIYRMLHQNKPEQPNVTLPAVAEQVFDEEPTTSLPGVRQDFLEVNEYSRPGTPMDKVNSIFVHYTANPGTSAAQNRSYFANLALTHERSASAHLIIGYDGELIQCIPFDEQAYAVMTRNEDSISIECCYLSEDGSFTQETYDTLIHTLAWLLKEYNLSTTDILRHYDCGGKLCPLYYAENEDAWEQLRQDVADYMAQAE